VIQEESSQAASDRVRDVGTLSLAATFLASFPPTASLEQERELASLTRVCEDGALSVQVEPRGGELVIRASGELDIASVKRLEDELSSALDSDASAVVLDLGGVNFIDSTGLRALLLATKLATANGKPLSMVRITEPVREVVELSGVERSLPLAA
jgi:anti-sigma B factor antagonist